MLESAPIDLLGRAVTVAYPLGDVLLLGALVGTLPVMSWRLAGSWPWVAAGLVCLTVADFAYSLTAATFVQAMLRYHATLRAAGCHLVLAGVGEAVMRQLARTGALERLGVDNLFAAQSGIAVSLSAAIARAQELQEASHP